MQPPSNDEGPRGIENERGARHKSNFEGQQWLWFHVWFIMTIYYKMQQILQNASVHAAIEQTV